MFSSILWYFKFFKYFFAQKKKLHRVELTLTVIFNRDWLLQERRLNIQLHLLFLFSLTNKNILRSFIYLYFYFFNCNYFENIFCRISEISVSANKFSLSTVTCTEANIKVFILKTQPTSDWVKIWDSIGLYTTTTTKKKNLYDNFLEFWLCLVQVNCFLVFFFPFFLSFGWVNLVLTKLTQSCKHDLVYQPSWCGCVRVNIHCVPPVRIMWPVCHRPILN